MQPRRNPSYNSLQAQSRAQATSVRKLFVESWPIAIIGCVLFGGGIYLTVWNEGRAVDTSRALDAALESVIVLSSNSQPLSENNERLVYLVGEIAADEPLTEMDYGVAVQAVKLKRRVQMFQWVEVESTIEVPEGGIIRTDVIYDYNKEWRDKLIDSFQFAHSMVHQNPRDFPLKSTVYINDVVMVGGFILGPEFKAQFNNFVPITSDERPEQKDIKLHSGLYYHCRDVWDPEIGDIRIQFSYAGHAGFPVTLVGMQVGNELRPYPMGPGQDVQIVREGRFTVEEIFWMEHSSNRWITWVLRGTGWFICFLGCHCLSKILTVLVQRNSLAMDLLASGSGSISLTVSCSSSVVAVALSWVWYRPLLAAGLFISAAIPFIWGSIKHSQTARRENTQGGRREPYHRLPD